MNIYIFQRQDGWYFLELKNDKEAVENAKCNPGTIKVTNIKQKIIWKN